VQPPLSIEVHIAEDGELVTAKEQAGKTISA
jgi:hypothetical protein